MVGLVPACGRFRVMPLVGDTQGGSEPTSGASGKARCL